MNPSSTGSTINNYPLNQNINISISLSQNMSLSLLEKAVVLLCSCIVKFRLCSSYFHQLPFDFPVFPLVAKEKLSLAFQSNLG